MYWQKQREAPIPTWRKPRNCADAKYLSHIWSKRARASRIQTKRYMTDVARRTLHDFEVRPGNQAWQRAVREAQKVFPGTESWLLSCSDAEGGWGRWVSYGARYSPQYAADHYIVGGWMQFKYPTFTGMYRNALAHLSARQYLVPGAIREPGMIAWQSALAQALAAGWARYVGQDGAHWSASWNTGCR